MVHRRIPHGSFDTQSTRVWINELGVRMQTRNREVNNNPVKEHDGAPDKGKQRRPHALVFDFHTRVDQYNKY